MSHAAVMVVEDDPALREALCATLDLAGYRSLPAGDGMAALSLLERERPALVVSDVQMQPMDGTALLHALRRRRPDLPVVLMTAFGTIRSAVQAVRDGVALLRRLLPDAVVLRTCLPDHPVWVMADATQVQQVILNLGANARDAMPEGGDLTVAVSRGDGDATIEVVDTGVGMTPEVQARVFEPFFTTKPRGVGTGLGLWLIHGVVKEHKGRVQVASTPGKGSRFTVTLPLTDAPSLPATPAPTPQVNPGVRVLLVEDNAINQELARDMLGRAGLQVQVAGDGEQALACLAQAPFDVVLMDCQMPVMDGYEATGAIRDRERKGLGRPVPIVALTAHAMGGDREKCLASGMDDYLDKPIRLDRLAEKIRQWTGRDLQVSETVRVPIPPEATG